VKKKTKLNVKGKKIFHPIYINWSNLNLGRLALTKINKNVMLIDLTAKIKTHQEEFKIILNNAPVNCFVIKQ